jgi:hypothetical protein
VTTVTIWGFADAGQDRNQSGVDGELDGSAWAHGAIVLKRDGCRYRQRKRSPGLGANARDRQGRPDEKPSRNVPARSGRQFLLFGHAAIASEEGCAQRAASDLYRRIA